MTELWYPVVALTPKDDEPALQLPLNLAALAVLVASRLASRLRKTMNFSAWSFMDLAKLSLTLLMLAMSVSIYKVSCLMVILY